MMIRLIMLVLTLSVVVGNDETTFTADCRDDIVLPCFALQKCQKYTSVIWYKQLYNNSSDTATVLMRPDKLKNSVSVDKNSSLVLRKVAPADSGLYKCMIRGKAGSPFCQTQIKLNISDCASTSTPIMDFSYNFSNSSSANISPPMPQVDNKTEVFVIWVYLGLAVSKLVLCTLCIWVYQARSRGHWDL